jgi:hypothetical protein
LKRTTGTTGWRSQWVFGERVTREWGRGREFWKETSYEERVRVVSCLVHLYLSYLQRYLPLTTTPLRNAAFPLGSRGEA